ncbi:hypothetical protein [Lentzea sp. CA-135723]|uniref:hypothetical protein n=1 Tax=Lentzea sp. CA-135723 TaxID=3239950 RepID=UPI003D8AD74A
MDKQGVLRRFTRFGVMGLAALGIMTVTAGAAEAKQTCSTGTNHTICFTITKVGSDTYDVSVGLDARMSRADAQNIIDQPGDPVDAWAMGADWFDNAEFRIPVSWVRATDNGLSAQFYIQVPYNALDEDSDGGDELYARARLFDTRTSTKTYKSKELHSPF